MRLQLTVALAVAGFSTIAIACNAIWGIDDPIISAGPDATIDAVNDVPADAIEEPPPTCGPLTATDQEGIFVSSKQGTDDDACGARAKPCASLQRGLARAALVGKKHFFVGQGTYKESITVLKDFEIEGGLLLSANGSGFNWDRICGDDRGKYSVIQGTGADHTILADNLGGKVKLTALSITSQTPADPGRSVFGIKALGSTTELELVDVLVDMGPGGAGTAGTGGARGADGGPNCPPGDAAAGAPGSLGVPGDGGAFSDAGFKASSGFAGTVGTGGQNGRPGDAGACIQCVTCSFVAVCNKTNAAPACGGLGFSGCGGGPGGVGGGGGPGGASVGIYAFGAKVDMKGGSLKSGAGGAGGAGGGSGPGGGGGQGAQGDAGASCNTDCAAITCGANTPMSGAGGTGTVGGSGGAGGAGGGGSGGFSFARVELGGATVTLTPTVIVANGAPGAGGCAPPGDAGCAPSGSVGAKYP